MKIYTQEQVIEVFEKYGNMSAINARNILDLSESIELPSDDEIEKQAEHEDTYSKKALLQEAQNGCGTEHLDATMSNNKESSIMWLYEKMFVNHGRITIEEFEQAKAMHKEEIMDANFYGQRLHAKSVTNTMMEDNAEHYYNETFGE